MSLFCNNPQPNAVVMAKPSSLDNTKQKDKIQFNSARGSNHEVAADNWRIRYYMNLNLVKQPHPMHLNQRSLSLPRQFHTPPSKMPSQQKQKHNHFGDINYAHKDGTKNRESRQNSLEQIHIDNNSDNNDNMDANDNNIHELHEDPLALMHSKNKKKKEIKNHKIRKIKSQNNTPPRTLNSLFRSRSQHRKKGIGLRQRSRSDGLLSFQITRSADAIKENVVVEQVDDNDSVGTADSVPLSSNSVSYSSRTPPRQSYRNQHAMSLNNRSKPVSISSHKFKPREDVDFKPPIQREIRTNPSDFLDSLNNDSMFDDDANFEMD